LAYLAGTLLPEGYRVGSSTGAWNRW